MRVAGGVTASVCSRGSEAGKAHDIDLCITLTSDFPLLASVVGLNVDEISRVTVQSTSVRRLRKVLSDLILTRVLLPFRLCSRVQAGVRERRMRGAKQVQMQWPLDGPDVRNLYVCSKHVSQSLMQLS